MPNWCATNIYFYSENKKEISDFCEKLTQFIKVPAHDKIHASGSNWLGNMLCYAGYDYDKVVDGLYGYCRGWVQYIGDVEENSDYFAFAVDVEDAWGPHIEPWRYVLDGLNPNNTIKIAWVAEEPGCEVYVKYDPDGLFFGDYEYNMDCYAEDDEAFDRFPELRDGCDIYTAEELMKIFDLPDMDAVMKRAELINQALDDDYDYGYITIHRYEEADEEF